MKKVVCIDNYLCKESLTNGRVYEVYADDNQMYKIENDFCVKSNYFRWRFIDIREDRRQKLEKIGKSSLIDIF